MKKTAMILTMGAVVLTLLAPSAVFASKSAKELKKEAARVEINEIADETLQRLLTKNDKAKDLYEKAYAWAVFDNKKVAFGFSGGGGNGVVVRIEDGRRTYMKMGTAGVGFGVGVNKYQVVFFFQDKKTAKNFVNKGWQADAGATAAAGKESVEGKTNFVNGLAIYQLTEKGLMINADLAGTKYWKDKDLN